MVAGMGMVRNGLAIMLLLTVGCVATAHRAVMRVPPMDPAELTRYYDYPRKQIHAVVRLQEDRQLWAGSQVEFDLQLPPELDGKRIEEARRQVAATKDRSRAANLSLDYTVRLDFFRPKTDGPHPLVVMSPILGGNTIFVNDFGRYFAAHGICAAVVHRKRTSVNVGGGLEQVEAELRKSVLRVRQALDWCVGQPEVDPSRMATFGISYGAIVNTMVAGAEPRLKYHVFALGGADLPDIIMDSSEPQIRRQVAKVARARGWSSEQLHQELRRAIKSDPLNSAPLLKPENVLMVVAQYDTVVGTRYENLLWKKIGKPRRIVVPLGHYTTAIALPFIKGEALRFLESRFGMPLSEERREAEFQFHSSKKY